MGRVFHALVVALFLIGSPAAAATEPVRIMILGDSIGAGYGLAPTEALDAQLAQAMAPTGRHVRVINASVSGDTTAGGLDRVDWMLGDKPDIVIVELGGNDALRAIDPATTERNLEAIITKLKDAKVTVWLTGMLAPRNLGPQYAASFDGIYRKLADKHGLPLYPFFLEGVAQDPALNQPDGIHPNPKGVEVLVKNLLPFASKSLDDYAASVRRPAGP